MAARPHRNSSILNSVGYQFALATGSNLRLEDIVMIHPSSASGYVTWEEFRKTVLNARVSDNYKLKAILIRDVKLERSYLVRDATDFDLFCLHERKEYFRIPVFTAIVSVEQPIPLSPAVELKP